VAWTACATRADRRVCGAAVPGSDYQDRPYR
jgi:hypothetical protein